MYSILAYYHVSPSNEKNFDITIEINCKTEVLNIPTLQPKLVYKLSTLSFHLLAPQKLLPRKIQYAVVVHLV